MAIHGHIEVRILSEGQPLREYDILENPPPSENNNDEGLVVRKYVESNLGANFELEYLVKRAFQFEKSDSLAFDLSIDGIDSTGFVVFKNKWENQDGCLGWSEGSFDQTEERTTVQKYRFNRLQLDETIDKVDNENLAYLGSIQVRVYRSENAGLRQSQIAKGSHSDYSTAKVPEKSLKGRANDTITKLDDKTERHRVIFCKVSRISDVPFITFIFTYLTRDGLIKAGIVKQDLSDDPFEILQGMTLDRDQIEKLYDIANDARQTLRHKVKREQEELASPSISNKKPQTQYDPDELEEIQAPPQLSSTGSSQIIEID